MIRNLVMEEGIKCIPLPIYGTLGGPLFLDVVSETLLIQEQSTKEGMGTLFGTLFHGEKATVESEPEWRSISMRKIVTTRQQEKIRTGTSNDKN